MKKIIAGIAIMIGALMVAIGSVVKWKEGAAISIIGGADGPTTIFLSGRVGNDISVPMIIIGLIICAAGVGLCIHKKL